MIWNIIAGFTIGLLGRMLVDQLRTRVHNDYDPDITR